MTSSPVEWLKIPHYIFLMWKKIMKNTLSLVLLMGGKSSRMGQDKSILKMSLLPCPVHNYLMNNGMDITNTELVHEELVHKKNPDNPININSLKENQNLSNDMDFFEHALFLLCSLSKANPHINTQIKISCRSNQDECIQERLLNLYSGYDFELLFDNGVGVCEAISMCLEKTQSSCLFIPCDTPFLTVDILQKLINAWQAHCDENNVLNNNKNASLLDNGLDNNLPHNILENNVVLQEKSYVNYVFSDKNTQRKQTLISIYTQEALSYLASSIKTKMPLQKAIPEEFVKILYYTKEQELFFQNLNTIKDLNNAKSSI